MDAKLLSVIIPNYNNEKYIEQCIRSVLTQTYDSFKIIVIDDCSTDGSREILEKIEKKEPLVTVVFLEINGGVSNARNIGIQYADTPYITCLDGDDFYFEPRKLEREMKLLLKYKEEGLDILAYSLVVRVDDAGKIVSYPYYDAKKFYEGNVRLQLLSAVTEENFPRDYCVSRDIVQMVGAYSYPKNYYEDYDLLVRLSEKIPFYCTKTNGTAYRFTPAGLSKRPKEDRHRTMHDIRVRNRRGLPFYELVVVQVLEYVNWVVELGVKIRIKLLRK